MNINQALKELRKNTTQKKTAENLQISYANYNKYETTNTLPDLETLIKIADYYRITLDSLVGHRVPFLLDKGTLTAKQKMLADLLPTLSDEICDLTEAYINGLKDGEQKHIAAIQKFKN